MGVVFLADSNITKKALGQALKNLMVKNPFEKINVGDICEVCGMNRKSFYYHFKDKYDLVEWIFYTEFIAFLGKNGTGDKWEFISCICTYFYKEREFYTRALEIKGQNSFQQYFREYFYSASKPFLLAATRELFRHSAASEFYVQFFCDAVLVSIVRWLTDDTVIPPDEYINLLKSISGNLIIQILDQYEPTKITPRNETNA